ncbi:MAG: SUMF1/EgtB/PvdO family nonheme iron enzyme [Myxococcota bacterium]
MGRWTTRLLGLLRSERYGSPMLAVSGGRLFLPGGRRGRIGAFLLDARPVTNAEYRAFVGATGARMPDWTWRSGFDHADQPVVGVSLDEARRYARWAGKRLPTVREWMRAARADRRAPYPWGDAFPQPAFAHYGRGSRGAPSQSDERTRRAGHGPFGHQDLAGNVWEWTDEGLLLGGFWGSEDPRLDSPLAEPPARLSAGIGFRCAV